MSEEYLNDNKAHQEFADQFVAAEVEKAKKALKQTQIIGVAVFLFIFFYVGSIAMRFQRSLQPNEAANMAKGVIAQKVMESEPELTAYLMKEVPAAIEKVPDIVKEQLPDLRSQLEDRLADEFAKYAKETSDQLDAALDQYLEENKDDFKTIMLAGSDPELAKQMMQGMHKLFVDYLSEKNGEEESIKEKIDEALKGLTEIRTMMQRLTANKNLTPAEKKTRRAIAVLMTTIDEKKAEDPLPTVEQMVQAGKEVYGQN